MAPHQEPDAPPPTSEPAWRRQLNNILETQISRYPFLVQMRAVWRQLQDERESWPILLPIVALVFFFIYRRERKIVEAIIRDIAD